MSGFNNDGVKKVFVYPNGTKRIFYIKWFLEDMKWEETHWDGAEMLIIDATVRCFAENEQEIKKYLSCAKEKNIPVLPIYSHTKNCDSFMKMFEGDILSYINAEIELAKAEMKRGNLQTVENAACRAIYQCKSDSGNGKLFDRDRAQPYIKASIILGDVFAKRELWERAKKQYQQAADELKSLTDGEAFPLTKELLIFSGESYFKLGKALDSPYFDEDSKVEQYLSKSISALYEALKTDYNDYANSLLGECCIHLGRFKLKNADMKAAVNEFENALHIFEAMLGRNETSDNYIGVCLALCGLGEAHSYLKEMKKAKHYFLWVQRTLDQLPSGIVNDRMKKVKCDCLIKISDFYRKTGDLKLCEIISLEAIDISKELYKKTMEHECKELTVKAYFVCGHLNKEYANKAIQECEKLIEDAPHAYWDIFKKYRYVLWLNGMIDKNSYRMVELDCTREDLNGMYRFQDKETGKLYTVRINIMNKAYPYGIKKILISVFTLSDTKWNIIDYSKEKRSRILRLCQAGKTLSIPNQPIEEYVEVTYNNGKQETLERVYQ